MKIVGQIQWLPNIREGRWARLAAAFDAGLPAPRGFMVTSDCPEASIRAAYDDIKTREYTHYVAVRGPFHAVIEVIGNDRVVHTVRALWSESAEAEILVQTMVNSSWCGKAAREGENVRIHASQGLLCLDPDTYVFDLAKRECSDSTLHERPRKVFRGVDGTTRTMQIQGERTPLEMQDMTAIADLTRRAESNITWVLDDRRVWLISTT